jgi:hypothetical protein
VISHSSVTCILTFLAYILENTPLLQGGGRVILANVTWRKNMKGEENKGENVKEKGRKGKEKR